MLPPRAEKIAFAVILLSYLVAGILFAVMTPTWQAPDEPAHYNYVAQVATGGCCPQIEDGDWQSDYQNELTTVKFAPDYLDRLDTIQYEDHQPPLYYLLASIIYKLTGGSLVALRIFSVMCGAGVASIAYLIGKRVFPDQAQIALGAMALVAFLPQHLAMLSAVNNDALAEVLIAVGLLWIVRYLQDEEIPLWQFGVIIGIGLITKATTYFLAGVIPLAILLKWYTDKKSWRELIQAWGIVVGIALVFGLVWWVRNFGVYGFPDFLGLRAHDAIVANQPRTADAIAERGFTSYLGDGLRITFNSFWGQFGWMAVPLTDVLGGWIYRGFALLMAVGFLGIFAGQSRRLLAKENTTPQQRNVWIILVVTVVLAVLAYLYYNTEFLQFQGRYMFPGLIPFALLLVYGVDVWRAILLARWKGSVWLTVIAFWLLMPLDIYLLLQVIVPNLSP